MTIRVPPIGILQGRLTKSLDGSIQFFPRENWQNEFKIAQTVGFECMELLVKKDSVTENPLLNVAGVLEIKRLSSLTSIDIDSVHGFYSKSSDYPEILKKIILNASIVGARTVLISFFNDNILASDNDKKVAHRQIVSVLKLCSDLDMRLGFEAEMMAAELKEFIESFHSPAVGAYYDIGNMASVGADVSKEILLLGKLIIGVHVKDRKPNGGETVILGQGVADIAGAFRSLKSIGYNGSLIIQGARKDGVNDICLNSLYLRYCKKLVGEIWKGEKR